MKLRILVLFVLLGGVFTCISAQITEVDKAMSQGLKNAIILDIPNAEEGFVEKLWKKFIKSYGGKTKKIRRTNEWLVEEVEIVGIGGTQPVNLYTQADELGSAIEFNLWIDLGEAYVSSGEYPSKYTEAEKLLMRFALFVAKESTRLEILAEEKQLKRLESTLKKLERDNDRYHRDIEQAKQRIAKAENNIENNVIEQDDTRKMIDMQKEVVELVRKRLEDL